MNRASNEDSGEEYMDRSRRNFLRGAFTATALLGAGHIASAQSTEHKHQGQEATGEGRTEAAPLSCRSDGTASLPVAGSSMNSPSTSTAPSSTTRTWPCRR